MALKLAPVPYPAITSTTAPWADEAVRELQCEQVLLTGPFIWERRKESCQPGNRFSFIHLLTSLSGSILLKVDYPRQHVPICTHYDSNTHSNYWILPLQKTCVDNHRLVREH